MELYVPEPVPPRVLPCPKLVSPPVVEVPRLEPRVVSVRRESFPEVPREVLVPVPGSRWP